MVDVTLDHKTSNKGNIFLLTFIHNMKAKYIIFPLMYGLLGYDHIWLRYN